jgi:hypothetical protein
MLEQINRKEVRYMKITKILVTGAAALVLGGSVAGVALASGSTPKAPKSATTETTSTVDTDSIELQQGNQTAPDTSTTSESASGESSSESDGPGGHQDPAGDVNHEFNGEE